MILLDTNILIYAQQPEHETLREILDCQNFALSLITKLEVLGYHSIIAQQRRSLEIICSASPVLPISDTVIDQAISLRQSKSMSLADAIIAATALTAKLELWTRNIKDYAHISDLRLHNPLADYQC